MRAARTILLVLAMIEVGFVVLVTRSASGVAAYADLRRCLLLLVIAWAGIARFQLGRSFSVTPQARQLITTGIYARIRNPIYLASPFLLIGLSLALEQWWPMLLLVVVVPLQIVRARREARILRAAFGDKYDRYRARTPVLAAPLPATLLLNWD
jgi:protein-S-isoprenylcysteine O-methyltransferase Ste14